MCINYNTHTGNCAPASFITSLCPRGNTGVVVVFFSFIFECVFAAFVVLNLLCEFAVQCVDRLKNLWFVGLRVYSGHRIGTQLKTSVLLFLHCGL